MKGTGSKEEKKRTRRESGKSGKENTLETEKKMPYKLSENGKAVMVKRDGKWVMLKKHPTHSKAKAHLWALWENVDESYRKKS